MADVKKNSSDLVRCERQGQQTSLRLVLLPLWKGWVAFVGTVHCPAEPKIVPHSSIQGIVPFSLASNEMRNVM